MKRLKKSSSALIALVAFIGCSTLPALAESEAGGFVFGGGSSESGGFYMSGAESNTQHVLWGVGSGSEAGGVNMSGAESESGGVTRSAASSESGGPTMNDAESEASYGGNEANLGRYVHYYGPWKYESDN